MNMFRQCFHNTGCPTLECFFWNRLCYKTVWYPDMQWWFLYTRHYIIWYSYPNINKKKVRGGLSWALKARKKSHFRSIGSKISEKKIFKKLSFFSILRVPPLDRKFFKKILKLFFQLFFIKPLFWVNISNF